LLCEIERIYFCLDSLGHFQAWVCLQIVADAQEQVSWGCKLEVQDDSRRWPYWGTLRVKG